MTTENEDRALVLFTVEYRLRGKCKWLPVTGASQRRPYGKDDYDRFTALLSKRHLVAWHQIELRQTRKVQP